MLPASLPVEAATATGQDLSGFVADITKSFNALPREPIFAALRHLGAADGTVRLWDDYFKGLRRRFRFNGLLGTESLATTGFPECCALSVVAMVSVVWAFSESVLADVNSR